MRGSLVLLILAVVAVAALAAWKQTNAPTAEAHGVVSISAGGWHTCAVTAAGGVKCWGNNTHGQLGDGTTTDRTTPVDVCADATCDEPLDGIVAVSAGFRQTCALTGASGVLCWGRNDEGELGDGTGTGSNTPVSVCADAACAEPLEGVANLSAEGIHSCAVLVVGTIKCWGANNFGELGDNRACGFVCFAPTVVCEDAACASPLSGMIGVSTAGTHTCALTAAGGVKCWGANGAGQLGHGQVSKIPSRTPVDVCATGATRPCESNPLRGVSGVSAGVDHTCALTTSGGLKCWGTNDSGALGIGPRWGSTTPVDVCADTACKEPLSDVAAVAAGLQFNTCALMAVGSVKCWGSNTNGQVGDGTNTNRFTPTDVCGDAACTASLRGIAVSAGQVHACALTTSGGVKCWGWNFAGQLGDGTTTDRGTPVEVVGLGGKPVSVLTPTTTEALEPTGTSAPLPEFEGTETPLPEPTATVAALPSTGAAQPEGNAPGWPALALAMAAVGSVAVAGGAVALGGAAWE